MAGSKLSFAVAALVEMYRVGPDKSMDTREIAGRTGLSKRYLEHVLGMLREAGIVTSVRGKRGGYKLRARTDELSLLEVWRAVREDLTISLDRDKGGGRYASGTQRIMHTIWNELHDTTVQYMQDQSIEAVVQKHLEENEMYYI